MNIIEKLTNETPDLNKVFADVIRANGKAETIDLSKKFFGMNEGGEGYIPDMTNHPALRAEVVIEIS